MSHEADPLVGHRDESKGTRLLRILGAVFCVAAGIAGGTALVVIGHGSSSDGLTAAGVLSVVAGFTSAVFCLYCPFCGK